MSQTGKVTFSSIAAQLEAFAESAVEKAEDFGKEVLSDIESVAETALPQAVSKFGQFATDTVTSLFGAAGSDLSGSEKKGLAVTTVLEQAEQQGIALLEDIASALVENVYTAVVARIKAVI